MSEYIYTYSYTYLYFLFMCDRLHLNEICLRSFLDIHLYSKNLSSITTKSSLIISEIFPACFSCSNSVNL